MYKVRQDIYLQLWYTTITDATTDCDEDMICGDEYDASTVQFLTRSKVLFYAHRSRIVPVNRLVLLEFHNNSKRSVAMQAHCDQSWSAAMSTCAVSSLGRSISLAVLAF